MTGTIVCGLFWFTYGLFVISDAFVWIPNGVNLVVGFVQLGLKLAYPSKSLAPAGAQVADATATSTTTTVKGPLEAHKAPKGAASFAECPLEVSTV